MGDRFKQILKRLGFSNNSFAKELKITEGTVRNIINGKGNSISPTVLTYLFNRGYNINWLLTGEGGMFLSDAGGSTTLTNRDLNSDRTGSANTGKPVIYDGDTFIDEDGNVFDGKKAAKAAYQAYLDRKNNSTPKPAAKDVISLDGLTERQKKAVIEMVNSYKDEK